MTIEAIASAIYNNVVTGLAGINSNPKISIEQLKDEVVAERNQIIREFLANGFVSLEELFLAINCIEVSCDYMSKCCELPIGAKALHFEIPPIVNIKGANTVKFVGSIDREIKFNVYTDEAYRYHKYKKRGADSPYVYIDTAINSNGNMDGYIFNLPFTKYISIIALFQDPRRLAEWDCCANDGDTLTECGVLSDEIMKRITEKYIRWYRQLATPVLPNTQQPK
ncbi:MAG: hypothetical protein KBT03_08965 [Bacteroidales bacterium]|nr:hypothetical protein [Candidatus Scybalousia scybalohippi]